MNFYMLVEGSRTEMQIYPAWFTHLLPQYTRIQNIEDLIDNTYVLESGYGIPSIYKHIDNAFKTLMTTTTKVDCFIISIDLEEESEQEIHDKIADIMRPYEACLNTEVIVLIQNRCIETWLLGNRNLYPEEIHSSFETYHNFYNVCLNDPEDMEKPIDFIGTISTYHFRYLTTLFKQNRMNYGKKSTRRAEQREYLEALASRTRETSHLKSFSNFIDVCQNLNV